MQQRRGRQDEDVAAAADDMNAVDVEYDDAEAEGSGGEELYNGCDWKTNIGGFLNFCKWRKWCADNQGITDFGPYGGVPTACPPEEEGADEPVAAADDATEVEAEVEVEAEAETPAEEARRRARARKSRARRGRKSGAAKKNKKASRKGGKRRVGRKNRKNRSG